MADKYITLHPNVNGTLDSTTDIYPNIKASQNILKDNGTKMEVQEKLTSGTNIKSIKIGSSSASATSLLGSGSIVIDFLNNIYPIGTIYTCTTAATITRDGSGNPICPIQTKLGGVWSPIYDKFLYAAAKGVHVSGTHDYYPGDTGGSKDLIVPYHTHTIASNTGQHTHVTTGAKNPSSTSSDKSLTGSFTIKQMFSGGDLIKDAKGIVTFANNQGSNENTIDDIAGTQKGRVKISFDATHVHQITSSGGHTHTINYAGSSGNITGANMPPYQAVYAWVRIS